MNKQSLKSVSHIIDSNIFYEDGSTFDLYTQSLEKDDIQIWFTIDGKVDMIMIRVDKIYNTKETMIVTQYLNEIKPRLETYKIEIYNEDEKN